MSDEHLRTQADTEPPSAAGVVPRVLLFYDYT